MNKRDLVRLEKLFRNEMIPDSPPFTSKSKQYERLAEEGYVQKVVAVLPGRFPVKITGWYLTARGHFAYCSYCGTLGMSEEDLAPD